MGYQKKHNLDGTINPQWKPDLRRRKGDRHKQRVYTRKSGFVAWDGEGVRVNGRQEYVLLLSSAGDRVFNPTGITTSEALAAMYQSALRNGKRYHVGFAFGYDVNMMLRDVTRKKIGDLWAGETITYRGWRMYYRNRREFAFKPADAKRWAHIWDVFGFFQSSFVEALRSYKIAPANEIERMKAQRNEFTLDDMAEIEPYCASEVQYLEQLMNVFNDHVKTADLHLTRYDGAGAVAASFFRKYGVKQYKAENPEHILRAARHSYYGGRIELVRYGYTKQRIYEYDLRSAYPAAITELPCLAHGEWRIRRKIARNDYGMVHVSWNLKGDVMPFPWRSPDGQIFFPRCGEGWYWTPEYYAALDAIDAGVISGEIRFHSAYVFHRHCKHEPFKWVRDMYEIRKDWKRRGIGAEKVLKLGLNSLYGKTAQRVGGKVVITINGDGTKHVEGAAPTWHQLEWSGYITARTRARIYTASFPAIKEGALVFYATDAIVSLIPLQLPTSDNLGEWEALEFDGLLAVQSGVYWLGADFATKHTRGFHKSEIEPEEIIATWARGELEIETEITRFVGMGRALMGDNSWKLWRTWNTTPKVMSLTPYATKRQLPAGKSDIGKNRVRPDLGLVATEPADISYWTDKRSLTTPIALPWVSDSGAYDPTKTYALLNAEEESEDAHE